jgi:hypothetical protein
MCRAYRIKYEVELCISLVHLVSFQQAEVRTAQQMVLKTSTTNTKIN